MSAAVVGVLLLCSSSAAAAVVMMGGDKDKPTPPPPSASAQKPASSSGPASAPPAESSPPASAPPASAPPAESPPPPPAPASTSMGPLEGYANFENLAIKSEEGSCKDDTSLNACKTMCNYDGTCLAFTYDSNAKKCCPTNGTSGVKYNEDVVTFVKTIPKYKTVTLGDRAGGNIKTITKDLEGCADECDKNNNCVGFSFQKDSCILKKEEGLASRYTETGKQFYERKEKPKPKPKEPFPFGKYSIRSARDDSGLCTDVGDRIDCSDPNRALNQWEKFTIDPLGNGKYSLQGGKSGNYCADEAGGIICNREWVKGWEKFTIEPLKNGKYALKGGRSGKYCADERNRMICNRDNAYGWETLTINKLKK